MKSKDIPIRQGFPYAVRMEYGAHPAHDVLKWCTEHLGSLNYEYCDWMVSPSYNDDTYYFKKEKHKNWFILRWQ
jgi:hypothetical protein